MYIEHWLITFSVIPLCHLEVHREDFSEKGRICISPCIKCNVFVHQILVDFSWAYHHKYCKPIFAFSCENLARLITPPPSQLMKRRGWCRPERILRTYFIWFQFLLDLSLNYIHAAILLYISAFACMSMIMSSSKKCLRYSRRNLVHDDICFRAFSALMFWYCLESWIIIAQVDIYLNLKFFWETVSV